jgi:hypothetical protein
MTRAEFERGQADLKAVLGREQNSMDRDSGRRLPIASGSRDKRTVTERFLNQRA